MIDLAPLPDGWEWATFADVATIDSHLVDPGRTPDAVHIAPNHIESWTSRLLPYGTVRGDKVTSGKHAFRAGHILYSKIRPYLAKAVLVDFEGLCSADMYPVSTYLNAGFLLRWMLTPTFTDSVCQSQGRTVLPKVNQEALQAVPVPVAPRAEQDRIVAKLDALVGQSRRAKEALGAIPPLLERLRQSILRAAFRGDLTADWRAEKPDIEPASELLKRIRVERRRHWEAAELARMRANGRVPRDDRWKAKHQAPKAVDQEGLPTLPAG